MDGTIYPSQHFPLGAAFVRQAGNFWILLRNIQKFYMMLTMLLNVLYGLLTCTALTGGFCITEMGYVYCAIRTESLYKTEKFLP